MLNCWPIQAVLSLLEQSTMSMSYAWYLNNNTNHSFVWLCRDTQFCYGLRLHEGLVKSIDYLMMDAKQAVMEEQHRRFQDLHREGRWIEALHQMHVTLNCAADLLNESLRVMDEAIGNCRNPSSNHSHPVT